MQSKKNITKHCNFCQRSQAEVDHLIVGENVGICNICVESIVDILVKKEPKVKKTAAKIKPKIPNPVEIKEYLDQIVIAQDQAKVVLSVAVHNHYKRLLRKAKDGVQVDKSNILLLGPTGSGKTLIVKAIANMLSVPMVIGDATTLTQAGYAGDDADVLLSRLLQAAGGNVALAEQGIIFIDEIDKIARSHSGATVERDVSGEGVQQALLKMIEGTEINIPVDPDKPFGLGETVKINTGNILFVCSGAFVGLEKQLENQQSSSAGIGFSADISRKKKLDWEQIAATDLVKYGMIPELMGRLPVITATEMLTEEQMVRVLTDPKDSIIKQYEAMFAPVKIKFDPEALCSIAQKAIKLGTGARSLRSILEKKLTPLQYNLSHKNLQTVSTVTITKEYINGVEEMPLLKHRKIKKVNNEK